MHSRKPSAPNPADNKFLSARYRKKAVKCLDRLPQDAALLLRDAIMAIEYLTRNDVPESKHPHAWTITTTDDFTFEGDDLLRVVEDLEDAVAQGVSSGWMRTPVKFRVYRGAFWYETSPDCLMVIADSVWRTSATTTSNGSGLKVDRSLLRDWVTNSDEAIDKTKSRR